MTMWVMHRLALKLCAVVRRVFAAGWKRTVVALAKVEIVIDMPVKMFRSVKPRSGADKYAA